MKIRYINIKVRIIQWHNTGVYLQKEWQKRLI